MDNTRIAEIFSGQTPSRHGGGLQVTEPSQWFPLPFMLELANEHSPGLHDLNT